jgi:hypothetical protein
LKVTSSKSCWSFSAWKVKGHSIFSNYKFYSTIHKINFKKNSMPFFFVFDLTNFPNIVC